MEALLSRTVSEVERVVSNDKKSPDCTHVKQKVI
jgi:hypothetical protein